VQDSESEVMVLASKISETLAAHPNADVAESACAIALEVARLRAKQVSLQWRGSSALNTA
jgi:hypothetical protein